MQNHVNFQRQNCQISTSRGIVQTFDISTPSIRGYNDRGKLSPMAILPGRLLAADSLLNPASITTATYEIDAP